MLQNPKVNRNPREGNGVLPFSYTFELINQVIIREWGNSINYQL